MDSQWMFIIIVAAVIVLAAVAAWMYVKTMKSRRLKTKFGPEYDISRH